MKRFSKIAIALTAFGFAAAPAFADADVITKKTIVDLEAYDLATVEGATEAHEALEKAAKKVCARYGGIRSVAEMREERACRTEAIEQAVKDIQSPQLARVHNSSRG